MISRHAAAGRGGKSVDGAGVVRDGRGLGSSESREVRNRAVDNGREGRRGSNGKGRRDRSRGGVKIGGEKVALALFKKLLQLCGSGALPVSDALRILASRGLDRRLKPVCKSLYKDIGEGRRLSRALERFPEMFDGCVCHLVEAGESTANLPFVFGNIIAYIEARIALRGAIVGALAYPVFLCVMACSVVAMFLFFMLPKIKAMMSNMGAQENFPIKLMDFIGGAIMVAFPAGLVLCGIGFIVARFLGRSNDGRVMRDGFLLRVPAVGRALKDSETARWTSLAAALFASGVNSTEAFFMSEKSLKNEFLRGCFSRFRNAVNDGMSVAAALAREGLLENEDVDVVSVGERTGNLAQSFSEISKANAESLGRRIRMLTAMLGGVALAVAFLLVFIFAAGIVLSILGLSQNIL